MRYKIVTSSTCITEYIVEANTRSEAEENLWDGLYLDSKDVDFRDENIESIHKIKRTGAK